MTLEEIFSQVAQHMVVGLMVHSQMCDYFNFLGLKGYSKCHEYHYFEENNNYKNICNYYITHHNKLILDQPFENPNEIPANWFNYSRQDVSVDIRKTAIKNGFEKWVNWEKITKKLYESYYKELINLNEIAAANELKKYIEDVDIELAYAQQKKLMLDAIDYNMSDIIMEQEELYQKCCDKIKEIFIC